MKTIFITIGEGAVGHNILRTSFWENFNSRFTGKIVFLTTQDKFEQYSKEFYGKNISFEILSKDFNSSWAKLLMSLAMSALDTKTNFWEKMRAYERGDVSLILTYFKRIYTKIFGNFTPYQKFLRRLILTIKPKKELRELFEKYNPDLVFATSITQFGFDVPVMVEARRQKVKILGMPRSWDNFTSHGLLRVVPDFLILQNQFLKQMARKVQKIKQKPKVIGLPHYDYYFDKSLIIERDEFFSTLGLNPNKKLILYGAMGDFLFPHEGELAEVFEELIEQSKVKKPAQILYRAHPRFESPLVKMKNLKHVIPNRKAHYTGKKLNSMEITREDIKFLISSIYHADLMVTGASTMVIDAVALAKPVVCIAFDGTTDKKKIKPWHSVEKFYKYYSHFIPLIKTGGAPVVYSKDQLAQEINTYLDNPEKDSQNRKKILDLFVEPFDSRSGKRLADALLEAIEEKDAF